MDTASTESGAPVAPLLSLRPFRVARREACQASGTPVTGPANVLHERGHKDAVLTLCGKDDNHNSMNARRPQSHV